MHAVNSHEMIIVAAAYIIRRTTPKSEMLKNGRPYLEAATIHSPRSELEQFIFYAD